MRTAAMLMILMLLLSTLAGCLSGETDFEENPGDGTDAGTDGGGGGLDGGTDGQNGTSGGDDGTGNGTGTGSGNETQNGTENGSGLNTSQPLGPLQIIMTVHIEGWNNDATDADAFSSHVERVESFRAIIEAEGIIANLEIRPDQFLAGVVNHGSDILQTWQDAGHAVEMHADLGGSNDNDTRLKIELGEYVADFTAAGLNTTSVSGVCSTADWVTAVVENGIKLVDGVVEYCLKSLPVQNLPTEYEWVEDGCAKPGDCHEGVFNDNLTRSMSPWRPISAENWVTPGGNTSMPIILADGPWNGTLACIAEDASVRGSDCVRDVEDTIVFRQGLEDMLAARQPGDFHGFIIGAASIGSVVGVQGMQIMAAYLATEVQAGNIEFVTAKEFVSRYEHWEATGDVPPASNTSNTSGLDLHEWEDLTYASVDAIDLKLDLYVPDSEGPHPLIIFIHGGAFFMGDKTDVSSKLGVTRLYDDGNGEWAIASINYRLTGVAIWPAQIQDCKAAVRWLRANAATYDIDPNMFVAVGTSAGGMLAAMLEVTEGSAYHEDLSMGNANVSSDVQGVIDWYGPVDAIMIQREAAAETDPYVPASPHVALLGCEYDNCSQALLDSATARTMVDGNESPILVMHGMADESVNVSNSMAFVNALAENGSNYTAHYLPNVGHGSDYAWNMPVGYAKAHIFLAGLLSEYRSS